MTLKEKYADLLALGTKLKIKDGDVREEGGKLHIKGTAEYQLDKDMLWDKIKSYSGWENEIAADVKVAQTDLYGLHTVKSGDTLSKLSKQLLGNAKRYMEIFNLNKDILKDPNLIKVGQVLKLPKKS